jgi:hypothetical protein
MIVACSASVAHLTFVGEIDIAGLVADKDGAPSA